MKNYYLHMNALFGNLVPADFEPKIAEGAPPSVNKSTEEGTL